MKIAIFRCNMKRSKRDSLSGAEDETIREARKRIKNILHPNPPAWSHKEASRAQGRRADVDPPSDADLPQELHCPVCLQIQWDPVSVPACGHELCRSCAKKLTTGKDKEKCPVCRKKFRVPKDWAPNRALMRLVDEIPVHCPTCAGVIQCGRLVQYGELKDHLRTCPLRAVICNAGGKCEKLLPLPVLRDHREEECDFRAVDCPSCGSSHVARDLQRHRREKCSQGTVICMDPHCDFTCPRCDIADHQRTCPKRFVACEMIGCTWQGTPETMSRHFLKDRKDHGEILLKRWETHRRADHKISNRGDKPPVMRDGCLVLSTDCNLFEWHWSNEDLPDYRNGIEIPCAHFSVNRILPRAVLGDDNPRMEWTLDAAKTIACTVSKHGEHARLDVWTCDNFRAIPSFCVRSVPSGKPLPFLGKFRCHYRSTSIRVCRVMFAEFAAWKEWQAWMTSPVGRVQKWSGRPEDAPVEGHRLVFDFYWASAQQAEAEGWKV